MVENFLYFLYLCVPLQFGKITEVFPGSSLTLIFIFFWLWCMSFLAFESRLHKYRLVNLST